MKDQTYTIRRSAADLVHNGLKFPFKVTPPSAGLFEKPHKHGIEYQLWMKDPISGELVCIGVSNKEIGFEALGEVGYFFWETFSKGAKNDMKMLSKHLTIN